MRASLPALAAALLFVGALTLAGCGLKGDLYLPESPPAEDDSAGEETESD
ncbi:MAG: hypothetical protein GVY32_04320 [Gammaproteobacteria bacterium]|jgi:predicted small lipoprotein YifL|nr:hypothetical protein [Gammaproteobacteria bacterium]